MRNHVAHPLGYHRTTPVDSARSIWEAAEIINRLWGASTPGGRLYPAPVHRAIVAIGWNTSPRRTGVTLADNLRSPDPTDDWTYVFVRAVIDDPDLYIYDSQFERTRFPTDYLWGPGDRAQAAAWLASNDPPVDEVNYLDRVFVLRVREFETHLPRRPTVLGSLCDQERDGTLARGAGQVRDHAGFSSVHELAQEGYICRYVDLVVRHGSTAVVGTPSARASCTNTSTVTVVLPRLIYGSFVLGGSNSAGSTPSATAKSGSRSTLTPDSPRSNRPMKVRCMQAASASSSCVSPALTRSSLRRRPNWWR